MLLHMKKPFETLLAFDYGDVAVLGLSNERSQEELRPIARNRIHEDPKHMEYRASKNEHSVLITI